MWNRIIISEVKKYLNEASITNFKFEDVVTDDYFNDLWDSGFLESYIDIFMHEHKLKNEDEINEEEFKEFVFEDLFGEYVDFTQTMKYLMSNNDGYISIYREITVDDNWLNHLKTQGKRLGIYWSWEKDVAEAHWGDSSKSNKALIYSIIKEEYVDWEETILLNINPALGDEKEIRLFKNTPLTIKYLYINGVEQDITDISNKTFYA